MGSANISGIGRLFTRLDKRVIVALWPLLKDCTSVEWTDMVWHDWSKHRNVPRGSSRTRQHLKACILLR